MKNNIKIIIMFSTTILVAVGLLFTFNVVMTKKIISSQYVIQLKIDNLKRSFTNEVEDIKRELSK